MLAVMKRVDAGLESDAVGDHECFTDFRTGCKV